MNRPRQVLTQALMEDLRDPIRELRVKGWPVEVVAATDIDGSRYRIEVVVRLDAMPVPVESQ